MSLQLINLNSDLKQLRDEGYDIEVRCSYLLIKNVPYVNSNRVVVFGVLVSDLELSGDLTPPPDNHVAHFIGDHPCYHDGSKLSKIANDSTKRKLAEGITIDHSFSSRPLSGKYNNYHEKMTTYIAIISSQAQKICPDVTAKTFPVLESKGSESVFNYIDTASSRAGIGFITGRLEIERVGIVGLGGTGSYILDLIAKTPVHAIHLFDGDKFLQHNAFRAPGAPSIKELEKQPSKVAHFQELYSKMHRNIIAHEFYIDASNVDKLREMNFVFLCLDKSVGKRLIVEHLEKWDISFIDVGMGVTLNEDALGGILRTTTSTAKKRNHVWTMKRIPFSEGRGNNDYFHNIQIADLNALNAALAVIKWKKLFGFYRDLEKEHFNTYTIDGNSLINEDLS